MNWNRLYLIVCLLFIFNIYLFSQKEVFIKQIEFKLEKLSDIDLENEYFVSLKLNKGASYIFKIANRTETFKGQAVIELLDADVLIVTNSLGAKYFEAVTFQCNKTGFYDLLIKFKDDKPGDTVVDILMKQ